MSSVAEPLTNPNNLRGGSLPPASFSILTIEEDTTDAAGAIPAEAWDVLGAAMEEVFAMWWEKYVVARKGGT